MGTALHSCPDRIAKGIRRRRSLPVVTPEASHVLENSAIGRKHYFKEQFRLGGRIRFGHFTKSSNGIGFGRGSSSRQRLGESWSAVMERSEITAFRGHMNDNQHSKLGGHALRESGDFALLRRRSPKPAAPSAPSCRKNYHLQFMGVESLILRLVRHLTAGCSEEKEREPSNRFNRII